MRRKILIALSVLILIGVAFIVTLRLGAFTPAAPVGWSQVHTGMTRTAVLQLVDQPRLSGWPEKICETRQHDGPVCHHRLFVWYHGEQVVSVWEGAWLRGYGWVKPRKELR